jgi:hypothetical protein
MPTKTPEPNIANGANGAEGPNGTEGAEGAVPNDANGADENEPSAESAAGADEPSAESAESADDPSAESAESAESADAMARLEHRRLQMREAQRRYYDKHKRKKSKENPCPSYCPERIQAIKREYYIKHRDEIIARSKQRYQEQRALRSEAPCAEPPAV